MANYSVAVLPSVRKDLKKVPKADRVRILARIGDLAEDPRPPNCKKLKGFDTRYRVRQGNYRILYDVFDNELQVVVVAAGQRGGIY